MAPRLVLALLISLSCGGREGAFTPSPIQAEFERSMLGTPGIVISIDSLGPRNWSTMYLFGPYTAAEVIRRCLNATGGFSTHGIESRDDIYVLMFRSAEGRISSMTLDRGRFTLASETVGREYPRGTASFTSHHSATSGRVELVPAGGLTRSCS